MDGFGWLDVQRIGEELADTQPTADPFSVPFPKLRSMVEALPGFEHDPSHNVNERILEAIQQAWADELDDGAGEDDE